MLETRGLTRLFGDIRAVDAVDLTVRPGGLTDDPAAELQRLPPVDARLLIAAAA